MIVCDDDLDCFWSRVDKSGPAHPTLGTPCWLWVGPIMRNGYGQISAHRKRFGTFLAHRVSFLIARGEIPAGLDLDHLCRVRNCVRPDHLEPVTRSENLRRGISWQRSKTQCAKGHSFSGRNLIVFRGRRQCRECQRVACLEYRARKRVLGARSSKEVPVTGDAG